jgi:tetratricopeptide (TPR) repeat protein
VCTEGISGDWGKGWSEAKDKWYRWQAHGRAVRDVMVDGELEEERGELASWVGHGARELNMLEVCESMYVEALAMWRRALPEDHPLIASSLNNLALLYYEQGRYEEAEAMYAEALAMWRRALPEDHPDIATSLNNLAVMYRGQELYDKAEPLSREALAMRKRSLPAGHPNIGGSLWGLALLNELKGYHAEALTLFEEVHAIWLAAYGPEYAYANLSTQVVTDKIGKMRQLIGVEADNELDEDDLQATLTTLQEMGFTDDVLNLQAIETHGNNIDAIMGALLG